jgi:hypothetical protein
MICAAAELIARKRLPAAAYQGSANKLRSCRFFDCGAAMLSSDNSSTLPLATVDIPRCAMCRARMELAGRERQADGLERRTFKCPKCEFVKTKIVGGPLEASRHRAPRKRAKPRA